MVQIRIYWSTADLDTIISERIALEDINKGFDTMRNGHSARSVIVFD